MSSPLLVVLDVPRARIADISKADSASEYGYTVDPSWPYGASWNGGLCLDRDEPKKR